MDRLRGRWKRVGQLASSSSIVAYYPQVQDSSRADIARAARSIRCQMDAESLVMTAVYQDACAAEIVEEMSGRMGSRIPRPM